MLAIQIPMWLSKPRCYVLSQAQKNILGKVRTLATGEERSFFPFVNLKNLAISSVSFVVGQEKMSFSLTSPSINVTARHSRTGLPVKEARNLPNLKIHEKKKKKKKRERKLRQQLFCTNNQANKENM